MVMRRLQKISDNIISLPSKWFDVLNAFAWVWLVGVLVLAHKWIGVLLLVKISKRVVDFAVFSLICSDIQQEVSHGSRTLGHLPIIDSQFWNLELGIGPFLCRLVLILQTQRAATKLTGSLPASIS